MAMQVTRLHTYWQPEQAHTVIEFLDMLREQLWELHGEQIIEMLRQASDSEHIDEKQAQFEFDDDIDF